VALNEGHVFPLLIAVALDDHLAIRFPLAFPDDRCFAWLALLDYGRSFAISVAVIRAYRHSGSDRPTPTPTPTSSALAGTAAHILVAAIIANTYFMNRSWRCAAPTGSIRCISFRSDGIDQETALRPTLGT
jgi:hypothetical protein